MLSMGGRAVVVALLSMSVCVLCAPADQYSRGVDWLSRYGYLQPPDRHIGRLQTKQGIERALREMQKFAGLKETGILDEDTLRLMSTPRCSLPDIVRAEDMLKKRRKRRKRYTLSGSRWQKNEITWSLHSYPSHLSSLSKEGVPSILTYALKAWSDVTPLNFRLLSHNDRGGTEHGDIRVSFASRFHEDGYPFDGRGGTLAHAFFPTSDNDIAGDTHFDDDEAWSYGGDSSTTDLFTVAVHEFGHALGLSHSSSDPSIMRPYYQGPVGDINRYTLPKDDILGIQMLYGKRMDQNTPHPGAPPTPRIPLLPSPPPSKPTQQPDSSLPDRCKGGFDAVANIRGEVFFFKGPYFWRIQRSGSLVSLAPALIQNFWMGLPEGTKKIDAVYERSDSHIVFFIGNQYWVFQDTVSLPGYPRPLSELGMRASDGTEVERVDAVFVWGHNGKTYLFSKGQFWRFTEEEKIFRKNPDDGYPHDAALWKGVPCDPDDIISWRNGEAYFFKGNSYWIFKSGETEQEALAAKSTAVDWMRCPKPPPRDDNCICSFTADSTVRTADWLLLNFSVFSVVFSLNVIW
ncbi:matrix metalloproteinase-25-like [Scleropages formosus]|uniref:Matrix metalloproteinase-25-like n=3 Tax=Scleropages formosus TaxID=113540 RepID=A0A8C9SLD5_SCLFO|nr:matrix metalloproteinase-25-like [Scleropages formosus]